MNLEYLYEDDVICVVKKPAGVATQTKRLGQADMESLLKNARAGKGEPPYIGVVHRLDQPVSGVMVFAKTKEAAAALNRQIATKAADKFYYAVTDGVPEERKATLEDYLIRDGKTNDKQALLRIKLETGRHHQIRVQLAHAGFPIVGDRKYNFKENMQHFSNELCLCSYKISFRHPRTKKKMDFEIDNPFRLT